MAKRALTPRQMELRAAQEQLKAARATSAIARQQVAVAKRRVAALCTCDYCGEQTLGSGADPNLCLDCWQQLRKIQRRETLARYGYGPDGQKLPAGHSGAQRNS